MNISKMKHAAFSMLMWCYAKSHPIEKKIVFCSFGGKQYSADPRAISETFHSMYPNWRIVWLFSQNARIPEIIPTYVEVVRFGSPETKFNYIHEIATARAFVTTNAIEEGIIKRKGQIFVQTWHGDRGFKKCLYESWNNEKRPTRILDGRLTDIYMAASDYGVDVYHKAFGYYGKITKYGMPRNDALVNWQKEKAVEYRKCFGIPEKKKILTYAPTFRDSSEGKQKSLIDITQTLNTLEQKGEKWVCLIRAHSASAGIDFGDDPRIIDVSEYPDMTDILYITDFLITDFSSCAGDYLVRNKPIVLAVFDQEIYEKDNRALRVNLKDTGYILAYNQDQLEFILNTYTEQDYQRSCHSVSRYYNMIETGEASNRICATIAKWNRREMG